MTNTKPTEPSARRQSKSRLASFRYAFSGLWYMLRTQRNAWIHAAATVCVMTLGVWLSLSRIEWAILALTIGLVWMAEAQTIVKRYGVDTTRLLLVQVSRFDPWKDPLGAIDAVIPSPPARGWG